MPYFGNILISTIAIKKAIMRKNWECLFEPIGDSN